MTFSHVFVEISSCLLGVLKKKLRLSIFIIILWNENVVRESIINITKVSNKIIL